MDQARNTDDMLPTPQEIALAVSIYVDLAYPQGLPQPLRRLLPPPQDLQPWIMSDCVERTPPDAPLPVVRSFALRLGNSRYPHMKLRLSRPPRENRLVFSVDAHDAFLCAPKESADYEALEQLKRDNQALVSRISEAWDAAGLPTERAYLRQKIQQARDRGTDPAL
jgi:hypothetical protein